MDIHIVFQEPYRNATLKFTQLKKLPLHLHVNKFIEGTMSCNGKVAPKKKQADQHPCGVSLQV